MKVSKKSITLGIISLIIVLASITLCILDWAIPLNIFIHPVLTLLLVAFAGFGLLTLVLAFSKKSPWFFFASALLMGPAVLYVTIMYLDWWISLIIMLAVWAVWGILSVIVCGNKTEAIAENESPDYKDYEERRREKELEEAMNPAEPIPQIKSFKK